MKQTQSWLLIAFMVLLQVIYVSTALTLTKVGKTGLPLHQTICNTQTTLEFKFNVSSSLTSTVNTNFGYSNLTFLDVYGNDLVLPLAAFSYSQSGATTGMVTGYSNKGATPTIHGTINIHFSDGTNNVYVWIPLTSTANSQKNPDVVDLSSGVVSNSIDSIPPSTSIVLSAFNFFDKTDFNQWYTSVSGTSTLLVSNFIFKITAANGLGSGGAAIPTAQPAFVAIMAGIAWDTFLASTGDKLCYASITTTGNFQTHLRESVPLWFIWFILFSYWLFYLFSDSSTMKIFDKNFEDNKWTCWSLYSIFHLAQQDFFTRLSRLTVMLCNWTIQAVFLAGMYGSNYTLGSPLIIWTAVIAFVATIPFPFIWGYVIHRKIYQKNLIKYENIRQMKGLFDKSKIEPFEKEVDLCQQKLYGYYHWFNCFVFIIFWICWPLTINQMQRTTRPYYHVHWYWLASMGICFGLEYFIFEPLLVLLFGNTKAVRTRGGYFYNFKLGEVYRAATI